MKWKKLEKSEYEFANSKYDFHARKEGTKWYLDVFNNKIKDANKAHIETFIFETFTELEKEVSGIIGERVKHTIAGS